MPCPTTRASLDRTATGALSFLLDFARVSIGSEAPRNFLISSFLSPIFQNKFLLTLSTTATKMLSYWLFSLFVFSIIIGSFGVSDADVAFRNSNHRPGATADDLKEKKGGEVSEPLAGESMWEQLVIRALANPAEWHQLREALDKVDEDLRTISRGDGGTDDGKHNQSKTSSSKWRFTYHRVMSGEGGGEKGSGNPLHLKTPKAFVSVAAVKAEPKPGNLIPGKDKGEEKTLDRNSPLIGNSKPPFPHYYLSPKAEGKKGRKGKKSREHTKPRHRNSSIGRTELEEEEILQMSKSKSGASHTFHWRPWVRSQDANISVSAGEERGKSSSAPHRYLGHEENHEHHYRHHSNHRNHGHHPLPSRHY